MSKTPASLRVYRLLAASHPEPLGSADLVRRLSLSATVVEYALSVGERLGVIRRTRPMGSGRGFSYTVNYD